MSDAFSPCRSRRRVAISALACRLEQRGVLTPYGNTHWCYTSTRGLLRNRAYLGEVRSAQFVNTDAHPPLTDPATWQLAQAPWRSPNRAQGARPVHLASMRWPWRRRAL
jgi:hypothetical protein